MINSISFESLNLMSLLPAGALILGALIILTIGMIKKMSVKFYAIFTSIVVVCDIFIVYFYSSAKRGFFDVLLQDGLSLISELIILISALIFLAFSVNKIAFKEYKFYEFFSLFLFCLAGFMFMVSSDDLMLIFLGLETSSLALYTMIALHNRLSSVEAALKYFTMGALASGFYVFSAMIFYALTSSVELGVIAENLMLRDKEPVFVILLASVFMMGSIGFKASIIPFHTWTPDVYEGSSEMMAGFLSVVPKIAAFVVMIRIFGMLISLDIAWLSYMLLVLSVVSMTLANLMALVQEDVKRMLAFSSISHAGFILAAVFIATDEANTSIFLYWIMFLIANFGAFGMLWASRDENKIWDKRYDNPFSKFSGMIKISPFFAIFMGFFMFALAGVPPFSVFWGKLFLISSAVNSGHIILALIMAVNSAIAVYYYLKLVVFMFLKEPFENRVYLANKTSMMTAVLTILFVLNISSVFLINPILTYINSLLGVQ